MTNREDESKTELKPTLGDMPSYGRCSDEDMLAAVSEALTGRRDVSLPEARNPRISLGHEIVPRINFNSLNRIITAFSTPSQGERVAQDTAAQVDVVGEECPLSSPLPRQTDETWKQVIDLFCKHGLAEPPVRLRDELVNAFEWAWIGHALTLERKP